MSGAIRLPEQFKIVQMLPPKTTNGGQTSLAVSLKNASKAWIIVSIRNAAAFANVVALKQATDVSPSGGIAGPNVPIWANEDVSVATGSDTLVKQAADAASYTTTSDTKDKQIVFEVDPARLTDGYPAVYVTLSDSTQATDFASIVAILDTTYNAATPPSAITN
jgi:hypothetical protein